MGAFFSGTRALSAHDSTERGDMSDFDTYTLNTAEAIDAAFAKTFGLGECNWAVLNRLEDIRAFLETLSGERRVWEFSVATRAWVPNRSIRLKAEVSNRRSRGGVKRGISGFGYDSVETWALMKAAIEWDQKRRYLKRKKAQAKREAARQLATRQP